MQTKITCKTAKKSTQLKSIHYTQLALKKKDAREMNTTVCFSVEVGVENTARKSIEMTLLLSKSHYCYLWYSSLECHYSNAILKMF